jgi:hypothetical protein
MLALMVEPLRGQPAALQHLVEEAQELRDRLHRIAVALSITEEMVADAFEQLARTTTCSSSTLRRQAKRARTAAQDCRTFAQQIDDLHREA